MDVSAVLIYVLIGATAGPGVGKLLRRLRDEWVDSGFALDRGARLERAAREVGN